MKDINILISNGVDVNGGLELLGDIEMYNETLEDFVTESEERLPKMEEYKNNDDMENYAILVHAMKSDSKYLGFTKLIDLSYQHELQAKENNKVFVNEHYNELITEANHILEVINNYLSS